LVDAADLDRGVVRGLHLDTFRHLVVDVVAEAELELELPALGLRTIADAVDLQHLAEAIGDARHEVLDVGPLHPPGSAVALRVGGRRHPDLALADLILHALVEQLHRVRALGSLDGEGLALDRRGDARWRRDRLFTNAGHQTTSASTSPPTFWSRASASDRTP